jgi:uncharacterized protein (TIGR02145 family)
MKRFLFALFWLGFAASQVFTQKQATEEIVTDIDGNVYHTITIGTQVWLVENLKTDRYRNGDLITNVTDGKVMSCIEAGAQCIYNNDSTTFFNTYGRLYNWYAVNDKRKIAPIGWHVPSRLEWMTLTTHLGGENVAGGKLKETGTSHWLSPNTGATDESGFVALPGGFRSSYNGSFYNVGEYGTWWSATEFNILNAWYRTMYSYLSDTFMISNNKRYGFSVRCVKD